MVNQYGKKKSAKKKPMTARQKRLAAMTPPKDKITRGDVIAGAKKRNKSKRR